MQVAYLKHAREQLLSFASSVFILSSVSVLTAVLAVSSVSFARASDRACIDAFAGRHAPSATDLWIESPFTPGTKYTAKSRGLSNELYDQIVKTTEKALSVCGPGCLMVGLGRSPTPIIAQAQIQGQYAISMPLSDFRPLPGFNENSAQAPKFPEPYDSPQLAPMFHELSAAEEALLFKHFDGFIGSRLNGLTRILLVDFSQSGASLYATQAYLEKWLSQKANAPELKSLSIGEDTYATYSSKMQNIWGVTSYRLNLRAFSPLARDFNDAKFDNWSEYTSYELGGRYGENRKSENGNTIHPYFQLRNTLALMNLARTNDRTQVPDTTRLPKDIFWDLETKTARNRTTGNPVELKFGD